MTTPVRYEKRVELPLRIPAPAVSVVECYFEFFHLAEPADILACLFQRDPVPGWRSYEGSTRRINLNSDLDTIFAGFTKGTRYEINRASKRDGVETSLSSAPTDVQLDEFMDYYDEFAATKGVPRIHRAQLQALARAKKLALSVVRGEEGSDLAAHAYLVSNGRARLTHSASLFRMEDAAARARTGRANRLLHWHDLTVFRSMGAAWYDFGGWYLGSRNEALVKINAFKAAFGGEIVKEWNCLTGGSRFGSLYLALRDLMVRAKN
jgi:Acetyltransferase (GNAT) domain